MTDKFNEKSAKWDPSCYMRIDGRTAKAKLIVAFCDFSKAPTETTGRFISTVWCILSSYFYGRIDIITICNHHYDKAKKQEGENFSEVNSSWANEDSNRKTPTNFKIFSNITCLSTPNYFMWLLIFTGCCKILHRTSVSFIQVSQPNFYHQGFDHPNENLKRVIYWCKRDDNNFNKSSFVYL